MNVSSAPGPASSGRLDPMAAPPGEGRDARGQFTTANKGGPGNPFARRVAALRQALLDALTPDDLKAIIARLVEAAQQGDVAAARLVLQYSVGKPAQAVDPDALDLHEWQHWQQMPVSAEVLQSLLGPLQVPLACTLARTVLPLLQEALGRQIGQQFNPVAPVPPNGDQACTAPVADAPGSPLAQPAARPGRKAAAARPEKTRQPQASTGNPGGHMAEIAAGSGLGVTGLHLAGLAAGGPTAGPNPSEAELRQWLDWLDQSLPAVPNLSPGGLAGP